MACAMVPANVFGWLEEQCLRASEAGDAAWLRLTQRRGRRVMQVTSFVGVIRAPDGFQIEVLPKVGQAIGGGALEARQLLIEMLCCLHGFRHVQTDSAKLAATRMPLLEVFIGEFLRTVEHIVKRGLRSAYSPPARQPVCPARQAADGAALAPEPVSGRPLLHRARRVLDRPTGEPLAACGVTARLVDLGIAGESKVGARVVLRVRRRPGVHASSRSTSSRFGWIGAWVTTPTRWPGHA